MNLFCATRKLTQSKEDHLTEFFAAALMLDADFRAAFASLTLESYARFQGWATPVIATVETQISYPNTNCRPDMQLTLEDGHVILCEHKLDAEETMGSETDERAQIERYLDLPIHGLLYVRSSWKSPSAAVLEHNAYIKPANREHFLWRDFYPLLDGIQNPFHHWIKEGFKRLGFTPPLPFVGDLKDPDPARCERNRRNFAKLWNTTRSRARSLGWKVQTGSIVELYLSHETNPRVSNIFVSPADAERFLIRFTPAGDEESQRILYACEQATREIDIPTEVELAIIKRQAGAVEVIDVKTTLHAVLGQGIGNPEIMEKRLGGFVERFLLAMDEA